MTQLRLVCILLDKLSGYYPFVLAYCRDVSIEIVEKIYSDNKWSDRRLLVF